MRDTTAGVSCGEGFVPEVVLCAVQSSPCSACWWIERYKVLPASEKWLGIAVLWCVGRVLSRSSGETARSEGCEACGGCICGAEGRRPDWRVARGLQGLAGLRGDAPSEARGVDGERAGRPRAARRSGGGVPSEARWDGGCGAGGRRQGQGGPRDRSFRAVRLACGDLAGGPPPTGA